MYFRVEWFEGRVINFISNFKGFDLSFIFFIENLIVIFFLVIKFFEVED